MRIPLLALIVVGLSVIEPRPAGAWQFEDEDFDYVPGLVATYRSGSQSVVRIDPSVSFDWQAASPDPRLGDGPFRATWEGQLFVRRGSKYVFRVHAAGKATLSIDGQTVLSGEQANAGWIVSEPVELSFGYRPIKIEYEQTSSNGRIALFWQSDQFELEPIPPGDLIRSPESQAQPAHSRGETLVRSRRCAACHDVPLAAANLPAPSLARMQNAVHADWLVDYLKNPGEKKAHVAMPDFGFSDEQAKAIAAYLTTKTSKANFAKEVKGNRRRGKDLAEGLGCLACHTIDGKGKEAPFGGGDLTKIAEKRPGGYFFTWLQKPQQLNADHRMPVFNLARRELDDLAAYLGSLGKPASKPIQLDAELAANGKKLLEQNRCASCHDIPGIESPSASVAWDLTKPGCLDEPTDSRPGYRMPDEDKSAVVSFLKSLPSKSAPVAAAHSGRMILDQKGCLNCHARGDEDGLREVLPQLGVTDPKAQAALVPPSLNSLGDKMKDDWLVKAVSGEATRLRPWLAPRMPKFQHSDEEKDALLAYFLSHDRIPELPEAEQVVPELPTREEMLLGAHRLIGAAGMGCMSCHHVGQHEPKGVELGALGSDLRFIGERMRKPWFLRWTRNPSRIVPGVEMPTIALANPSILDGKVRTQLEALWTGLNAEHFDLPTADAVQHLSADNFDRTQIIRDPFEFGEDDHVTRPFAIGLVNGHNLLIDLDTFSIRAWWIGDFARQKTRGKTWYWETAGVTLYDNPQPLSMIALASDGKTLQPSSELQAVTKLRGYRHLENGIRFKTLVQFGNESVEATLTVTADENGAKIAFEPIDAGSNTVVFQQPAISSVVADGDRLQIRSAVSTGTLASTSPLELQGDAYVTAVDGSGVALTLQSPLAPPYAAAHQKPFSLPPQPKDLPCTPGYEVTRLPLDDGPMPAALAWRPDGTLAVASLKGGVFIASDTTDDGMLNEYSLFSDHLAAPYGLAADGDDVIVTHKPELLRLHDSTDDGFADDVKAIATGWGTTFDYHDWLVGLLRDSEGNWYASPSVQQDDRPLPAAVGRGKVLKITPEGEISEFAAGVRFAMGLAMNDAGAIFATDNQGVTNPFNELNHIRPGKHYGFWNKLEPRSENQETELAAIQIPHPWTRSVNGIAFIPEGTDFGPFAGQLIGADYTARKLIRMSVHPVGGTYQGAAYPFSIEDLKLAEEDKTFLGPLSLAFGPDGALYVGSIIDSGWGGGNNRGAIERVTFKGDLPFGIREVRAHSKGFDIDFTSEVDAKLAADPKQYTLSCYRRIHQGGYATPDQDRTNVQVKKAVVADDRLSVRLFVEPLRPTFVYDIAVGSLDGGKEQPFPEVAYYSLNAIPEE